MKIVALMSSPKKESNTAELAKAVLEGAAATGDVETKMFVLAEQNIEFCNGCMSCMAIGRCVLKDDFEMIKAEVESADGIVWASPTYMGSYNAQLRKLMERFGLFEHMTSKVFGGKYNAVVSTAGGNVGNTVKDLSGFSGVFGRSYYSGGIGLPVRAKKAVDYPEVIEACRKLGAKLAGDIRKKRTFPLQKLSARILTRLVIRPMNIKVIRKNKEGSQKAVYQSLKERGLIAG